MSVPMDVDSETLQPVDSKFSQPVQLRTSRDIVIGSDGHVIQKARVSAIVALHDTTILNQRLYSLREDSHSLREMLLNEPYGWQGLYMPLFRPNVMQLQCRPMS